MADECYIEKSFKILTSLLNKHEKCPKIKPFYKLRFFKTLWDICHMITTLYVSTDRWAGHLASQCIRCTCVKWLWCHYSWYYYNKTLNSPPLMLINNPISLRSTKNCHYCQVIWFHDPYSHTYKPSFYIVSF